MISLSRRRLCILLNQLLIFCRDFFSLDRLPERTLQALFINCSSNCSNWPCAYRERQFQLEGQIGLYAFNLCAVLDGLSHKISIFHLARACCDGFHSLIVLNCFLCQFDTRIRLL